MLPGLLPIITNAGILFVMLTEVKSGASKNLLGNYIVYFIIIVKDM
jgi:hypothetical protein